MSYRAGRNGGRLRNFVKGQSGNPAGRPKKRTFIEGILGELGTEWEDIEITVRGTPASGRPVCYHTKYSLDGHDTFNAFFAASLLIRAMNGDIEAIKIVLDRTEGKVPPPLNLGGQPGGHPVEVVFYTPEKRPASVEEQGLATQVSSTD